MYESSHCSVFSLTVGLSFIFGVLMWGGIFGFHFHFPRELKGLPFFPKFIDFWISLVKCLFTSFDQFFFVFSSQKLKLIEGILFVFWISTLFFLNYLPQRFLWHPAPLYGIKEVSQIHTKWFLFLILIWTFTSVNFPASTQLIDPVKFWYVVFLILLISSVFSFSFWFVLLVYYWFRSMLISYICEFPKLPSIIDF